MADRDLISDPIIVLGAPRSGTSTVYATLYSHPSLWSLHGESTHILEGPFHPARPEAESHLLTERDLTEAQRSFLQRQFFRSAGNVEKTPLKRIIPVRGRGNPYVARTIAFMSRPWRQPPIRLVEKTIPNTMRIRFLNSLFPRARFIHLTRHPRANITAMYRGWKNPERHNDYPLPAGFQIQDFHGSHWAFVLPPGWRKYDGRRLVEICAFQWRAIHEKCLEAESFLPANRYLRVRFEDVLLNPMEALLKIARWGEFDFPPLARFRHRLPSINVSRTHRADGDVPAEELTDALQDLTELARHLGYE